MAAAIVYEGVGGGGALFGGLKFCLLQQIPTRNHWKALIVANGGEVVPLENQADIVIADHARKNQPVGSISWTFLDASVKNGELANKEDHDAGPTTRTVRPVGSSQPAKMGRTPFTVDDDRVLMNWCVQAERKGLPLQGNEIYKQLEAHNNRHTFQSWRDRWIKHVSLRQRPEENPRGDDNDEERERDEMVEDNEPGPRRHIPGAPRRLTSQPTPNPAPAPARSLPKRPAPDPVPTNNLMSSPMSPNANPFKQKSRDGNVFSDADTQIIRDHCDDIMNINEDENIEAWVTWASVYPNHTAQEWRNHFVEYMLPKVQAERRLEAQRKKSKPQAKPPRIIETIPGPSAPRSANKRTLEVKNSQGSSGETIESRKHAMDGVDQSTEDKETFRNEVLHLAKEFKVPVDFQPVIHGRKIPLFRLWHVVESEELGGYDEVQGRGLWHKVAQKLNFNEYQHSKVAAELETFYTYGILADYAEVQRQRYVPDEELTESQEVALINDQLRATADREMENLEDVEQWVEDDEQQEEEQEQEEEDDDDLDRPQSTPRQRLPSPSGKRSFESRHQGSLYTKRQRIDKGKGPETEIPSTPEDVIAGNHNTRPVFQSSPLKFANPHPEHHDNSDDDGAASDDRFFRAKIVRRVGSSPLEPPISSRRLDPETQDFHFLPEQEEGIQAAPDDLTPSPGRSSDKLPDQTKASDAATHGTVHSSNKNEDSSTQSQTESQHTKQVQECVDYYISLGYSQDVIIDALESTSMEATNAGHVMEKLVQGEGIPEDIPGVFTWEDDQAITKRRDSPEFEKLVKKHGIKRVGTRKRFLKAQKKAMRIAQSQGEG